MKIGDKVKLIDAKKLGEYGLRKGTLGAVNSISVIEGELYAMFSPENDERFYWINSNRLEVVEEEESASTE